MPNYQDYTYQDYTWFKKKKNELVDLISESSEVINDISLTQYAKGLQQLGSKVDRDTFKIQIVGTFNNGKSTLINALLGEDVLPTKVVPSTAVINEIKYGETKKAILNFRNPLPETLLSDIPAATLDHMKSHDMKDVPPMEIDYNKLSEYVTIPMDGDPDEASLKSPYLSVELFYPSPLLKEGVEIIDSPGLNENDERTAVTLDYLDKADAIIFLFDANRACAKDEMEILEDILVPKGFDNIFFVVNRFDVVLNEKDQKQLKCFVEKKVKNYTTNEIYYISALKAIEGKVEKNEDKLLKSGFPPFEKRLAEFLAKDKGKIKLAKPAKELKGILGEVLSKAIPSQKIQLSTNIQDLQERYEGVKPELAKYESQKETLKKDLELEVERQENNITRAINNQFCEIADSVSAWVEECQPKNNPGIFGRKSQVQKVEEEIREYVNTKVKEQFGKWNKEVLVPLIEESVVEVFKSSDGELKGILDGIDQLQSAVSGEPYDPNHDESSGWTRAIGVAGICCGFASGASLLTGHFDTKTLAKSMALDLGVGTGLLLLGITNPIIAIGGVVVVLWRAIAGGKKVVIKDLKEKISIEKRNSIINNSSEKSKQIVAKIDVEFKKSIATAIKAIDIKISDLKTQIEDVLKDKERGEEYANKRINLLNQSESKLQEINRKLDDL